MKMMKEANPTSKQILVPKIRAGRDMFRRPLWVEIQVFRDTICPIEVDPVTGKRRSISTRQIDTMRGGLQTWDRYNRFLGRLSTEWEQKKEVWFDLGMRLLGMGKYKNGGKLSDEERERLNGERNCLTLELELCIESFYIFAQILLDRVADLFRYYFDVNWTVKGASSHVKLADNFKRICAGRNLQKLPADLGKRIHDLEKRVIQFRNKFIEHASELNLQRSLGGSLSRCDGVTVHIQPFIWGKPAAISPDKHSENLSSLLLDIEEYIKEMILFLGINRSRSVVP